MGIANDFHTVSDVELIEELEDRGYHVVPEEHFTPEELMHDLNRLYLDYQLTGKDFFNKQIREFFNKYLNTTLIP